MASKKNTETARKRGRVSQMDVPKYGLNEAVRVAKVLEEHYGGSAASPMDVATSLKSTPSSSWFRMVTGAAIAFGLTEGGYNAPEIKLTDLGRRVVAPTSEGDDVVALREALLKPRVTREFLTKYDRKKLPPENIAINVLSSLGVAHEATERSLKAILASARYIGALRKMKGDDEWVDLHNSQRTVLPVGPSGDEEAVIEEEGAEEEVPDQAPAPSPAVDEPAKPKPIFVGHGKNKKPQEKVVDILNSFGIPSKVAVSEANLGQPIPTKVKNVMKQCGSAVLIFTKDEQFLDKDGKEVWRPSENVVYELGAASYAYDDRVVIFMEKGLEFPANFESIGHITFDENGVEAKTMDFMKELIGFGLLKVTPAG